MAKLVITNSDVNLGAVDYTAQVDTSDLTLEREGVDTTNMGDSGWRTFLSGLKSWTVTVNWVLEADLSGLSLALWNSAWLAAGTGILAFIGKQSSAAVSAANPTFSGSVLVPSHRVIGGQVGSRFEDSITFQGTGAVTRATS